jgi:hypothetical protein
LRQVQVIRGDVSPGQIVSVGISSCVEMQSGGGGAGSSNSRGCCGFRMAPLSNAPTIARILVPRREQLHPFADEPLEGVRDPVQELALLGTVLAVCRGRVDLAADPD